MGSTRPQPGHPAVSSTPARSYARVHRAGPRIWPSGPPSVIAGSLRSFSSGARRKKENRLRAVLPDSLDRHGTQAEAARRAALGGTAMTLQAAEDLAHDSTVRGAGPPH